MKRNFWCATEVKLFLIKQLIGLRRPGILPIWYILELSNLNDFHLSNNIGYIT